MYRFSYTRAAFFFSLFHYFSMRNRVPTIDSTGRRFPVDSFVQLRCIRDEVSVCGCRRYTNTLRLFCAFLTIIQSAGRKNNVSFECSQLFKRSRTFDLSKQQLSYEYLIFKSLQTVVSRTISVNYCVGCERKKKKHQYISFFDYSFFFEIQK